jgi:AraC-like DNA-binding protein
VELGEHISELGQWQTVQQAGDPRLRAYVHGYFASSSRLPTPVRERHLPSTEVSLLLNFGTPHRRLDVEEWTTQDGAWVVGLQSRHQITEAVGERHFMVVRFTPMGAHLFLGLPMHLIANQSVDLKLIDPALARLVFSRIGAARTWSDRFKTMELLIAERVTGAEISRSVGVTWKKLVVTNGRMALGTLVSELDCSHRTLVARFRTCVGLPPKTIARLLRFNRAVRLLDTLSPTRRDEPASKPYIEARDAQGRLTCTLPWADIAADCGYFDQAHLIKEFREFAGRSPTAFLRHISPLN